MIDYAKIAEVTGYDLADTEALRDALAVEFAERMQVLGDLQETARSAVYQLLGNPVISKITAQAGAAIGPATSAAAAWSAFREAMSADMADRDKINLRRMLDAQDLAIANTYRVGQWWSINEVIGPESPTLIKPYDMSLDTFEGQVSPRGFVFSAARGAGRRDALRPSFYAPYPDLGPEQVYVAGKTAILPRQLNSLPSFKMAKGALCDSQEGEASCKFTKGDLPKGLKWLYKAAKWVCIPVDLSDGCSVPARAWWPYCLGAAPAWGWVGQRFPLPPLAATIAAAIQGPTPLHLSIRAAEVETSLYAIVERTGIARLPVDPGQTEAGVFRRGVRLVFRGNAPQVGDGPPVAWADAWSPASGLQAGQVFLPITGRDLAEVIDAHLRFLALRRALLLALPDQPPELRDAAALSPDYFVREAAAGRLPSADYDADDPLRVLGGEPASEGGGGLGGLALPGKIAGRPARSSGAGEVIAGAAAIGLGIAVLPRLARYLGRRR